MESGPPGAGHEPFDEVDGLHDCGLRLDLLGESAGGGRETRIPQQCPQPGKVGTRSGTEAVFEDGCGNVLNLHQY